MSFKWETLILRDKDWLHDQFVVKGMTAKAVADLIGCEKTAVHRWLERHGIKVPKPKHYMRNTKVYQAWIDMVRRCGNPKRDGYSVYGGRGIRVAERWLVFENFYADMGDPPEGMSLERMDVNGHYEPGNCKWATTQEQSLNTTRSRFVVVDGEKMNVVVAAKRYEISPTTLKWRLDRGWPHDDAVKRPIRRKAA